MTVKIDVRSNANEVLKKLNVFQKKHIPLIVSDALNEVGTDAVNALRSQFAKKLDRPKPDTVKSPILFKAKPRDLSALVFIKDKWNKGKAPAEYLEPMLEGSTRLPKKNFVVTPRDVTKTNKFGNITAAQRLKYFEDKEKYFVGVPKGYPEARYGVWERYGRGSKGDSSGYRIRKVVNLAKSQRFAKRFDFFKTVNGVVKAKMNKALDRNIKRYVR
jgi:hypothetical protein